MSNERFVNALQRRPQKTPPVWMMRQAGRYHQHYQKLKEKYSFVELCKQPELAAETAMGPIRDFDFDVSILFSDLLFPLEAMGMGLAYNPGPQLEWQLTPETLPRLRPWQEALPHMQFQKHAVAATRALLPKTKSLIGFVGGPWTLYTYAVEGAHKGALISSKTQMGLFREFAAILMPLLKANIELQFEGGAEVVMIFDTAAGEISSEDFQVSAKMLNEIAGQFPGQIGYYSKGTGSDHLVHLGEQFAGMGYDHRWHLPKRLRETTKGFVQGNFDQALLFDPGFAPRFREFLKPFQDLSVEERCGWVCGLGHGVLPQTPEKHVRQFVDIVRESFA